MAITEHLQSRSLVSLFTHHRFNKDAKFAIEKSFALEIIANSDSLQSADPATVGQCIIDVGVMGLTLSPNQRLAYLIPYKIEGRGMICTLSVSYMGLEHIAYRTGVVSNIQTNVVREGDEFRVFVTNNRRQIEHEEAVAGRGKVTHAYCIATYKDGSTHIEVMDRADLDAVKQAATRKNRGKVPFTWTGPFRYEMYKKSVLRRAWKSWPKFDDPKLDRLAAAVDRSDPIDFGSAPQRSENKGEASLTLTDCQIGELVAMMVDAGVPDRGHDRQLLGLAKAIGYQNIQSVKFEDFEKAKATMKSGLERRNA